MNALNLLLSNNLPLIVTVGVLLICGLMLAILKKPTLDDDFVSDFMTQLSSPNISFGVDTSDITNALKEAVGHYVDVSAVVKMVRELEDMDENALEMIKSYPETVRAAVMLYAINRLGADCQAEAKKLSSLRSAYAADSVPVRRSKANLHSLEEELSKRVEDAERLGLTVK